MKDGDVGAPAAVGAAAGDGTGGVNFFFLGVLFLGDFGAAPGGRPGSRGPCTGCGTQMRTKLNIYLNVMPFLYFLS